MAITGTFLADFSSFLTACDQAEVKLRSFETGSNKVEAALSRMTDTFSGRKVIQDATLMTEAITRLGGEGGIAAGLLKLTDAELAKVGAKASTAADKLRAMGTDVPPGMQRIADATKNVGAAASTTTPILGGLANQLAGMFTVGAIVQFGREVLAAGDTIVKMSDQTGLATDEVQKFQYIAGQSGTSVEALVGAVQNLQQRLGDDNSGAAAAMKRLGINADTFNKLGTYDQMVTLASAIQGVHDPTEQASDSAALFGKTWKEILPAIKSGMKELGDEAPIMADSTVKSLDRIGDAMTRAKQVAIGWGGTSVLAIEGFGYALGNLISQFDPEHFGVSNAELLKLQETLARPLPAAMAALHAPTLAVGAGIKAIGLSAADAKAAEDALTDSAKALMAINQKMTDAMVELNAVGVGWKGTLDTIDGAVVEGIKYYLEAGVAQGTLATAYGLTAAQVKAVSSALADEATAHDTLMKKLAERNQTVVDGAAQIKKAEADLADFVSKKTLDSTDYQISKIWQRVAEEEASFKGSEQQRASFNASSEALAIEQAQALRDAAAAGAAGVEAAAAREVAAINQVTGSYWQQIDAAARAAGVTVVGNRPGEGGSSIPTGPSIPVTPMSSSYTSPFGGFVNNLPKYAAGGPVLQDGPIYAHAGEFVTPAGGASTVVHNVFNIVDTEANIVRRVSEALTRSVLNGRKVSSA